jgi:hypothetical protein
LPQAILGYGAEERTFKLGDHHVIVPKNAVLYYQVTLLQLYSTHLGFKLEDDKCEIGSFWSYVGGGCQTCPGGKYQPQVGGKGCYACPAGQTSDKGAAKCGASAGRKLVGTPVPLLGWVGGSAIAGGFGQVGGPGEIGF